MNNELLKDIETAGRAVEAEVVRMENAGILPLSVRIGDVVTETITSESLRGTIADIKNSRLTIAVCGVVKAGKSTFLNSILFGGDVLPTFPTPCTAKLTFITHADGKPGFIVRFFTSEEFKKMRSELSADSSAKLQNEIDRAQSSGVSPQQIWGGNEEFEGNSFEELKAKLHEYASEDGCFTPFVREIELRINRPELKGLFIVDTPGLDDPNPLNSRETETWAQRAHAVIYLMPWRGMSAKDKAFIEGNFGKMSEESTNRLFVITKIDENAQWPDTMRQFKKDFPAEATSICGYSAYADLLQRAEAAGEVLSEDEEWTLNKWKEEGFRHDPSRVRDLIAKRLFEGGGKNGAKFRIEQLKAQIRRCYELCISQRKGEVDLLSEDLKGLGLERDEAKKNAERLKNLRIQLQGRVEDFRTKALGAFANGDRAGFGKAHDVEVGIKDGVGRILDRCLANCTRDSLILPALREARLKAESLSRTKARDFFMAKIQDANDALYLVVSGIKTAVTEAKCDECIREPDTTPFNDKGNLILREIELAVNFSKIDECIHWYNKTDTNKAEARAAFIERADETIKTLVTKIAEYERFGRDAISAYVRDTLANVESMIDIMHGAALSSPEEKQRLLHEKEEALRNAKERLRVSELTYAECIL